MPERRVFVLGAGFSCHAGFPLVRDLMPRVLATTRAHRFWNGEHAQERLRLGLASVPHGEYEEVLQALLRRTDAFRRRGPSNDASFEAERTLRGATTRLLWECHEEMGNLPEAYRHFAQRIVNASDTIISFNWDVLVEAAITAAHGVWSYSPSHGRVPVLKPHGSINWHRLPPSSLWAPVRGTGFAYPLEDPLKDGDEADAALGVARRAMIFPGEPDDPESVEDLRRLWRSCAEALEVADRVVFIGYSLPGYDHEAARFFRSNCEGRVVEIVNPNDEHRQHLTDVLGVAPLEQARRFEQCSYALEPQPEPQADSRHAVPTRPRGGWGWPTD